MTRFRFLPICVLLLIILSASGCGQGLAQVDGLVVWADGRPASDLQGSHVVFESTERHISARGIVDADGTFRLATVGSNGIPPGDYRIALIEHRKSANLEGTILVRGKLDPSYSALRSSGLSTTLKSGTNPVSLKVRGK